MDCACGGRAPRDSLSDVVRMGIAFTLIFTAFQTSSSFQTPLLKDLGFEDLGFTSLSLLYAAMCTSIFVAPHVIRRLGARPSIAMGATAYCLFIASLIHVVPVLFLIASALNGVGAALLWTSQGSLLTQYSVDSTRGRNAGVFWALTQMSLIFGSITSYIIVPPGSTVSASTAQHLYVVLTASVVAGTLLLSTLRRPAVGADAEDSRVLLDAADSSPGLPSVVPADKVFSGDSPREACGEWCSSIGPSLLRTVKLMGNMDLLAINSLVMFSGFALTFWQGKYPLVVSGRDGSVQLPPEFEPRLISWLLLTAGVTEAAVGVVCGRLADRYGNTPVVIVGMVANALGYGIAYTNLVSGLFTPDLPLAFITMFLLAVGDSIVNTLCYALLGRRFSSGESGIFALFFFFKSGGAGLAFLYTPHTSMVTQFIILAASGLVGTVAYVSVDRKLDAAAAAQHGGEERQPLHHAEE